MTRTLLYSFWLLAMYGLFLGVILLMGPGPA